MGPYYRGTSQGVGHFFDRFYEHPVLMLLGLAVVVGVLVWRWQTVTRKSSAE